MVKNFFEYVKELIPEKGSVFFTIENHSIKNDISLYELADLICGQKCKFASEVLGYSWNVPELYRYSFPTMGVMFVIETGEERWCHFSKEAFAGAICIVAMRNGITFDDDIHEQLRQVWERRLNGKSTEEEEKKFKELENYCMNFDDIWYIRKRSAYERGSERKRRLEDDYDAAKEEEERKRREEEERIWYEEYCRKSEQRKAERKMREQRDYLREHYEHS